MSSIIQLLPDHVANQIAAGEVVQRPASVVKELLENAVDAKATDIKLIINDAGKTLIQVIDNGIGMSIIDARLCFERHATSKIKHAEDLFALQTKGFRGEALASIAAIAHVELKTRQEQDELGTHLRIEGSKFIFQEPCVLPKGTTFLVKNLFFNIPARRNFLKSDTVEMRHILDEFHRVALAHPKIHFSLIANGNEIFNLPSGNLRQRIVAIFMGKTNEKLVPVEENTEIVSLKGFISKPDFAKKSRGEQFFFVNNRYIKSGYLHHAVLQAYDGLLKDDLQPSYFIFLDVPPHSIDINIHPTKTEIKFDDEHALYAILRASVKHSLGQFNVAPILDFDRDPNLDTPYSLLHREAKAPHIEVNRNFNPFATETFDSNKKSTTSIFSSKKQNASWESLYIDMASQSAQIAQIEVESEEVNNTLFQDESINETRNKSFQINRKYIACPIKSGLLIIHQSRAHQRILYEKFLKEITLSSGSSQQLLFPLELVFTIEECGVLKEIQDSLQAIGFLFEFSKQDAVIITGIPDIMLETKIEFLLQELIKDYQEDTLRESFSQNDKLAKLLAKNLAIKSGKLLVEEEQEQLINQLFACKEHITSPFQKNTYIQIEMSDLEKKFNL